MCRPPEGRPKCHKMRLPNPTHPNQQWFGRPSTHLFTEGADASTSFDVDGMRRARREGVRQLAGPSLALAVPKIRKKKKVLDVPGIYKTCFCFIFVVRLTIPAMHLLTELLTLRFGSRCFFFRKQNRTVWLEPFHRKTAPHRTVGFLENETPDRTAPSDYQKVKIRTAPRRRILPSHNKPAPYDSEKLRPHRTAP